MAQANHGIEVALDRRGLEKISGFCCHVTMFVSKLLSQIKLCLRIPGFGGNTQLNLSRFVLIIQHDTALFRRLLNRC
ncbi:hypothetical protein D3C81_2227970 [compost metagenome]